MKTRSSKVTDQPQPIASRTRGASSAPKRMRAFGKDRRNAPPPTDLSGDSTDDDEFNHRDDNNGDKKRHRGERKRVQDNSSKYETAQGDKFASVNSIKELLVDTLANRMLEEIAKERRGKRECELANVWDFEEHEFDDEEETSDDEDFGESAKEYRYRKTLTIEQRLEYDNAELRLKELSGSVTPLKYCILDSNMPELTKARCLEYVKQMDDDDDSSDAKRRSWLTTLLKVPFGTYSKLEGRKESRKGTQKFIKKARSCLDSVVYGNNVVKGTLQELVAQRISNPMGSPPIIGLVGPPGVGKTTLARYGIAKALNKPFHQISCGGLQDASSLRGHSFTWEGSTHGAIVDAVIQTKCMDPVILLDEVDKIGDTKHGQEVQNMLIHLLDPTQNCSFQDEYFSGIDMDFSRIMFVLSLNDNTSMSPILRDRVHFIQMDKPTNEDKFSIAKDFLIKQSMSNIGIEPESLAFSDEAIRKMILDNCQEEGVRNLSRCIEGCIRKINLLRYLKDADKLTHLNGVSKGDCDALIEACKGIIHVTPRIYDAVKPRNGLQQTTPPVGILAA